MSVNGVEVDFTLDTGSDVTIITEETSKSLNLKLEKPERVLVGADQGQLEVVGESEIDMVNKKNKLST